MKMYNIKIIVACIGCSFIFTASPKNKRITVNKIDVRVNGVNILSSALKMPRLAKNGKAFTRDEAIFDELLFQRARDLKMLPTDVEIEHQINNFKIQNGLENVSDDEFEKEIQEGGLTMKEYKQQYGRLIAVENIKRTETSEKLMVTSQEVEQAYKKHPPQQPEAYHLKIGTLTEEECKNKNELIADNKIEWEDLGFIEASKISKDLACVFSMKPGDISEPIQVDDHFEIISVVDKKEQHEKTLKESYQEVERALQEEKKERCLKDLENDLKEKATLVYL